MNNPSAPLSPRAGPRRLPGSVVVLAIATAFSLIAYENGSYEVSARNTLAVVVWWTVAFLFMFDWRKSEPGASQILISVALIGFSVWTLASVAWSPSVERTVDAFNLASLYVGSFLLLGRILSAENRTQFLNGLTLSAAGVAALALASRFFPTSFGDQGLGTLLPGEADRLSFPIGYWNGLAILLSVSLPLVLRITVVARSRWWRASAAAMIPALGSAIYLTSSRTGSVAAIVGALVLVALSGRRWTVAIAASFGFAGSLAMAIFLSTQDALVNGPFDGTLAARQGREAALALLVVSLSTAIASLATDWVVVERLRPSPAIGRLIVGLIAVLAVAAFLAAQPVDRVRGFTQPLAASADSPNYVEEHLLSASGNGRWQLWTSSVEQWKEHPVLGGGAGTFEQWWAAHATYPFYVRNAHSVYAEALGELGLVGLGCLLLALCAGLFAGTASALAASGSTRELLAAATASVAAYCLAAGMDWVWQLPAVTLVAVALLAVVSMPRSSGTPASIRTRLPRIVGATLAFLFLLVAAIPLLTHREVEKSAEAARRDDLPSAVSHAIRGVQLAPWFSTPRVQVALVAEAHGELGVARRWVASAIERSPDDWRLWAIRSRIEEKSGDAASSRASLEEASRLNPSSPALKVLMRNLERRR